MRNKEPAALAVYFILATISILFGARHPLVQGFYSFLTLLVSGGWIILNFEQVRPMLLRKSTLPPLLIILFIFCTSLSLPVSMLEFISPFRAHLLSAAAEIADLQNTVNSLSYFAPDTRFYAIYLLGLLLYFFCASNLFGKRPVLTTALWIMAGIGMFEAAYGLLQAMVPSLGVLWLPANIGAEESARGTIIYRNQYAAMLNMLWPMALVLGINLYRPVVEKFDRLRKKKDSVTLADRMMLIFQKSSLPFWAAGFMVLAVIFSRSRGGIFIMISLALLFLFLLPLGKRIKGAAGGVFLLFTLAYGGMIGFRHVIERFYFLYDSALGRMGLWLDSLGMLRDHMLTGIGMGSYQYVSSVFLKNVPARVWFDYAHNEYVELAVELGIPALVLLLAWMGWGIIRGGRDVARAAGRNENLLNLNDTAVIAIGSSCAMLGFLLHALADFIWRLPANAFYAVTVLAMLSAAGREMKGKLNDAETPGKQADNPTGWQGSGLTP